MNIEKVVIEDAKELLSIYAPYVKETAISFEYEVPTEEEFANRIQHISYKYPYIKAIEDGRILGYAYANTFKGRQAYDWSVETTIYLRQDAKRRGIGKCIVDLAQQYEAKIYSASTRLGCDITKYEDVCKFLEKVYKENNKIDYIINSAGILKMGKLLDREIDDIRKDIEINYVGSINVA